MRSFILAIICAVSITFLYAQEISFRVMVYDKVNRAPVTGATVKLQDLASLRDYKTTVNDSGFANFKVKPSARYRLEISAKKDSSGSGYLTYTYMLSEKEVASKKTFEADMEKVRHTESGLLPAMHFEYNNPTLSSENRATLDNLLRILKTFGTLQIEIGIYADCHENAMMITKRALAINDYLKEKDDAKHARVKEYGNVRALNQCDCSNPNFICSEEKYLENRRAEFKVISF